MGRFCLNMATVSLCMMVKNEEKILARCLESIVEIADEIIIVDTGSTDKTVEIAQKYVKNVYHKPWFDDFSGMRNYVESLATKEYILRWDGDWVLDKNAMKTLKKLKQMDFFECDLVNFSLVEKFIEHEKVNKIISLFDQFLFFFYKRGVFHWESPAHDELIANNPEFEPVEFTDMNIKIFHFRKESQKTWRQKQTLDIIEKELQKKGKHAEFLRWFYARELYFMGRFKEAQKQYMLLLDQKNNADKNAYIQEKIVLCMLSQFDFDSAYLHINTWSDKDLHPRLKLIKADVLTQFDTSKALKLYESYIQKPFDFSMTKLEYDVERFNVHPFIQIGKMYLSSGNVEQGNNILNSAITKTNLTVTKEKIKTIITLFS
jgi:glycosyltransferase involved in cell wall biosynthesis